MRKPASLTLLLLLASAPVHAQDIVGLEDCSRATGPDRKIGCLQSNVNYLYDLVRKNDAAAQARLRDAQAAANGQLAAANAQLAAAKSQIDGLRGEIDKLKAAVGDLQKKAQPK